MDPSCLKHCLTDDEQRRFEQSGYLIVQDAMSIDRLHRIDQLSERMLSLATVFNDRQIVPPCNPHDRHHVCRLAVEVHQQNGRSLPGGIAGWDKRSPRRG